MIRQASSEDQEVLAEIIRESFRDVAQRFGLTGENAPAHASNCRPDWIARDMARGVCYFILSQNARPVGCVAVENPRPEVCYLERLAVLPEMRGRHFGSALVRQALDFAVSKQAEKVSIGVIDAHVELQEWYKRFGFVPVGTRCFPHLPFQVCFMELGLAGAPL
jgi:N-acetylglutamate synthase-like GNAT family acetyltransferase